MVKTYALLAGSLVALSGCTQPAQDAPPNKRQSDGVIRQMTQPAAAPAPKIIKTSERVKLTKREFDCMARNVYHEAGVENHTGKIAVAQVTLNRVKSKKWGTGVCDVVFSKAQFSWTLTKKKRQAQPTGKLWDDSVQAVKQFENGTRVQQLTASLFYHTTYIKQPRWADATKVVAKVGQHIFYSDARKS